MQNCTLWISLHLTDNFIEQKWGHLGVTATHTWLTVLMRIFRKFSTDRNDLWFGTPPFYLTPFNTLLRRKVTSKKMTKFRNKLYDFNKNLTILCLSQSVTLSMQFLTIGFSKNYLNILCLCIYWHMQQHWRSLLDWDSAVHGAIQNLGGSFKELPKLLIWDSFWRTLFFWISECINFCMNTNFFCTLHLLFHPPFWESHLPGTLRVLTNFSLLKIELNINSWANFCKLILEVSKQKY